MADKIILVDDNEQVLDGYKRKLRKRFDIVTANGGKNAINAIKSQGPFSVIVTDMRMPGIDGVELLNMVQELAPSMVRMMLTGNMDQTTAVKAMNEGHVFRFLNKPCDTDTLAEALDAAILEYKRDSVERELLNTTVRGVIAMLCEVLSQIDPDGWRTSVDVMRLSKRIAETYGIDDTWDVEIAAVLARLGEVTLPWEVRRPGGGNVAKTPEELSMLARVPESSYRLLKHIPRFDKIARYVRYQALDFAADSAGELPTGSNIPLASRILKVAIAYCSELHRLGNKQGAFDALLAQPKSFDPAILELLKEVEITKSAEEEEELAPEPTISRLKVAELEVGMLPHEDIQATNGVLLTGKGTHLTEVTLERIKNYAEFTGVKEPIVIIEEPDE